MNKRRILLGLSGGVDSTAAAILLFEKGWEVIALNYILTEPSDASQNMAEKLGIEHHTMDITDAFQSNVIGSMIAEYERGRTPNPCAVCNPTIKWPFLYEYAKKLDIEHIATGHYANIALRDGLPYLARANDRGKDQSYFMYRIDKQYLEAAIFPLGDKTRKEAEDIVHSRGLLPEKQHKSRDLCFLEGNKLQDYLRHQTEPLPGDVVIPGNGKVGRHPNIKSLTVGQRRGLKTAWKYPLYVLGVDLDKRIAYASDKAHLLTDRFTISDSHWTHEPPSEGKTYTVQIRNTHRGTDCTVKQMNECFEIAMTEEQYAITPGQVAVIYDGDIVLGGGIIAPLDYSAI